MKRIQEKVKDIVEVRPYNSIRDFTADPAETLLNYHFTDATADLMAKWLDGIASVQGGKGTAFALAGYRGVGKSHFLAALRALPRTRNFGCAYPNRMSRSVLSGFSGAITRSLTSVAERSKLCWTNSARR